MAYFGGLCVPQLPRLLKGCKKKGKGKKEGKKGKKERGPRNRKDRKVNQHDERGTIHAQAGAAEGWLRATFLILLQGTNINDSLGPLGVKPPACAPEAPSKMPSSKYKH